MRGIRWHHTNCVIQKSPKWVLFKELIKFQVIGLGLPMILEYFWQLGFVDFIRKAFIAFSRLWSSLRLLWRSKTYTVYLGTDPKKNVEMINQIILN